MLPLSLVANPTFPYDMKLDEARRFLAAQGISNPRPIRRSLPYSDAYEAWLARSQPRLKLISSRAVTH